MAGVAALFLLGRVQRPHGWDDAFYMAQLSSAVRDGDLLLHNDLLAFPNPFAEKFRMLAYRYESGELRNEFSIGPAVLHAGYLWPLLRAAERPFGDGFRAAAALGSMACLVITVLASAAIAERFSFSRELALLSAFAAALLGPLAAYGPRLYLNAHLGTALFSSLAFLAALRWLESGRVRHALACGLASGLLAIMRWQDAVIVAALVPAIAFGLWPGSRARLAASGVLALAFAAAASVQLGAWRVQYGSWLLLPQGAEYMEWTRPKLGSLLFSPYHGLVPWTPGFALGLVGIVLVAARERDRPRKALAGSMALAALATAYASACVGDWWGGSSYGARRLTSLTPVAAVGLAAMLARLGIPARTALLGGLGAWTLVALNAFFWGCDDLGALVLGRPATDRPADAGPVVACDWSFSLLHVIRPGFSFSAGHPGTGDRLVAIVSIALVVAATAWLWRSIERSAAVQRWAVGFLGCYVCGWVLWLCFGAPDNHAWSAYWREVARGRGPAAAVVSVRPGLADAARVLRATYLLRGGDEAAARDELRGVDLARYDVDFELLRRFAAEPQNRALIESSRDP